MEFFRRLIALLTHLGEDASWRSMIDYVGPHTIYAVLFAIIFCETGLVVTPFLPGDSLIFAIGAVAARGVLSAQAYGVSPSDPLTLAVTIVGLVVVAALASAVPAWRAIRIDAARALRGD